MPDLLRDRMIRTDREWLSLPGLLAALARGEVSAYPALRPHQRPAWHMFLVQLAVLALDAAGRAEPPVEAHAWREALRRLTPDYPEDEPWRLIVADRARPAFLQPPDPGGLKWTSVVTPDALDMLITSRNHDVKREIAREAEPQDWIFALVSLQTMEGFGGAGNYGVARMNGGSSSRVLMGLAPAHGDGAAIDPSAWWARDVNRLLPRPTRSGGASLLWVEPWEEGQSPDLGALDPLFIEVCRRIRLLEREGRVHAERSTSKAPRIAAKDAMGNTGDPWAPIHIADGKSLTLSDRDFTHEMLADLLFTGDKRGWTAPELARAAPAEEAGPMLLVAEAFARGNSKTDGFRSRVVRVPAGMAQELRSDRAVAQSADILRDIAAIDQALRNGLALVAAGGEREKVGRLHHARSRPAREAFRREADLRFFPELWARLAETTDEGARGVRFAFLAEMAECARSEFRAALPGIPCASLLRPRAEVRGERAIERGIFFAMRDPSGMEGAHA